MWNWQFHQSFPPDRFFLFPLLVPALIWSTIWKGLALYRAARNSQKVWFVVLLLANSLGILEIIYLLLFSKSSAKKKRA